MSFDSLANIFAKLRASLLPAGFLVLLAIGVASAQYGGGYPYSSPRQQQPRQRLPNSAQRVGGINGTHYRQSSVRPTGMPLNQRSYFGGGGGGGNPMAHRPKQKPFSNYRQPRPLITSQEAARIEVARGLWRY